MEAVGEAREEADAVVGRLRDGICESGVESGLDALAVAADGLGKLGERRQTAAPRPNEPEAESGNPFVALLTDGLPHRLIEQIAAVERAVEPLDGGEASLLAAGEVLGVLADHVAVALDGRSLDFGAFLPSLIPERAA